MLKTWPTDHYEQLALLEDARRNVDLKCSYSWQSDRDGQTHNCCLPFGHLSRIHTSDLNCICGGYDSWGNECNMKISSKILK